MTSLYKYRRITTPGPDGTTLYFRNADDGPRAVELCDLDGSALRQRARPRRASGAATEIEWQPVTLDDALREQIKKASRACRLIDDRMQEQIRAMYSAEDEMYYARIGTGVALGVYTFEPGEQDALLEYGAHVEAVRQWGRGQRAELGL